MTHPANTATNPTQTGAGYASHVADQAVLFVIYYGRRDVMQSLLTHYKQALGLEHEHQMGGDTRIIHHNNSPDIQRGILLEHFTMAGPPAHDTEVVQLILNARGPASTTWHSLLRQFVEAGFPTEQDLPDDDIWGYTLIYTAIPTPGTTPADALETLLPLVHSPHAIERYPSALARADLPGNGALWLLDIPLDATHNRQAATVYAAMTEETHNDAVVDEWFLGPVASMLMPDLIAHKSYYNMRQYRTNMRHERYKDKAEQLRITASALLTSSTGPVAPNLPQQGATSTATGATHFTGECVAPNSHRQGATGATFAHLKHSYADMLNRTTTLDRLRIALEEQKINVDRWRGPGTFASIHAYHQQHIETAMQYLALLVDIGQGALNVSQTAVEFMRADIEQKEERREQVITMLLAVLGIVLAIPQLVTWDVACSILAHFGLLGVDASVCDAGLSLWPFWVQMGFVVVCLLPFLPRLVRWVIERLSGRAGER